jgi:hypothetical protein
MTQFGINGGSKGDSGLMAGVDLLAGNAIRARESCMR